MEQSEFDNLIDILKEKALNGDVDAMRNLGDAYYQGPTGKEKNISAAFPYWKKAADNGDAFLALKVAYAYIRGDGCEQDDEMAFYYFQLAADGGNVESQYNVGLCCENGIGCPENLEKAKKYYRMAALSMNGEAQWRLGAILFNEKNTECYHWICCAHISGVSKATDFLNQMIQD